MGYQVKDVADVYLIDTTTGEKILKLDSMKFLVDDDEFKPITENLPSWNFPREITVTLKDATFNMDALKKLLPVYRYEKYNELQYTTWRFI